MPKKLKILEYPQKKLLIECKEVTEVTFNLHNLASDMMYTMGQVGGVGLAANQVGRSVRLIVMKVTEPYVMFNPKVLKMAAAEQTRKEGCLSFPDTLIEIPRAKWIKVQFRDINWEKRTLRFSGLEARCVLHEIDHLNGKTMLDVMPPLSIIHKREEKA